MDGKTKIIEAIRRHTQSLEHVTAAQAAWNAAQTKEAEAREDLIRTLHAVLGGRARHGVVFQGLRFWVDTTAGPPDTLRTERAEFEVLG